MVIYYLGVGIRILSPTYYQIDTKVDHTIVVVIVMKARL